MTPVINCVIVDDSLFVRKTLESLIKSLGHNVLASFDNAKDAIDNILDLPYDIIFLDIILPDISGLDALRKIFNLQPDARVIILSGLGDEDVINAALQLGAIDYIQKPIDEIQLRKVIETVIESYYSLDAVTLSKIEATAKLTSLLFNEILAISNSQVRRVVKSQIESILLNPPPVIPKMFNIDVENLVLSAKEEIFGVYEEDEVIYSLRSLIDILKDELTFIYSEDYVEKLFQSAMLALVSKQATAKLVAQIDPKELGVSLPEKIDYEKFKIYMEQAQEEIEDNLLLATVFFGQIGPEIKNMLGNTELVPENVIVKSSIFYLTLVGFGEEKKGLFGPLPASDLNEISAIFYSLYPMESPDNPSPISTILVLFYRFTADRIVEDFNRINFIFRTRLAKVQYLSDISKVLLRGIMEDIIENYRDLEDV